MIQINLLKCSELETLFPSNHVDTYHTPRKNKQTFLYGNSTPWNPPLQDNAPQNLLRVGLYKRDYGIQMHAEVLC